MPLPEIFVNHLRSSGYHPRSNKHSNVLAESIVVDFLRTCGPARLLAAAGRLVYNLNVDLYAGTATWNIDLAIGPPAVAVEVPPSGIARTAPSIVQIAVEIKTVMTEHRKAVKNRKRDFEAHHQHVHNYNEAAIAGVVLVVNGAPKFRSPLLDHVTTHRDPPALVAHCLQELRGVTFRRGKDGHGVDVGCAIVVSHDNIDSSGTRYLTQAPAPQIGDPLHYDAFIQRCCAEYAGRFD